MFRRHWRVAGPCAPTCNALCVCVLILISYEISRRDNYPHDSFSTAPCSINIQHYIRDGGGGLMDRAVPELAASTLPGGMFTL